MAHHQPLSKKGKTLLSFFKKKDDIDQLKEDTPTLDIETPHLELVVRRKFEYYT